MKNKILKKNSSSSAVVLFSGGQDSTVCLFWAKKKFEKVNCVFFDYGQKHKIELNAARKIAQIAGVSLEILKLNSFSQIGGSSLTDKKIKKHKTPSEKFPLSFVPGRNLVFLSLAASYAYVNKIHNLITGVSQADYSGYPDCRKEFISAARKAISLALSKKIKIHAPLINLTKKDTVALAVKLGCLSRLKYSHSCYEGLYPPCGKCPACLLRKRGFKQAGVDDPLLEKKT